VCSHIIVLAVTLKLVELFPQASMQIPIGQIRKRGRPRLCEVSDQVQDKISNQFFKNDFCHTYFNKKNYISCLNIKETSFISKKIYYLKFVIFFVEVGGYYSFRDQVIDDTANDGLCV
jgi:hypothetical protein